MGNVSHRPFYGEFAWAYDFIIEGAVSDRCDFAQVMLSERGVLPGSMILDAGCGTGSYSIELTRKGYEVVGIDASAELISEAQKKSRNLPLPVTFEISNILGLPSTPEFAGILCRGVLNDITDDTDRQDALLSFARALRKAGVLILDIREWHSTALRKTKKPVFEKSVKTARGNLAFRSVTELDDTTRQLIVCERHVLEKDGVKTVAEYEFVMRCWLKEELHDGLTRAGFDSIMYFGDYARNSPVGSSDRIVAVASLVGR